MELIITLVILLYICYAVWFVFLRKDNYYEDHKRWDRISPERRMDEHEKW